MIEEPRRATKKSREFDGVRGLVWRRGERRYGDFAANALSELWGHLKGEIDELEPEVGVTVPKVRLDQRRGALT